MKITIIGAGYVGLVSGAGLAEVGHDVVCVDVDFSKTQSINSGVSPIYENGLDELLLKNVSSGRLRATTDIQQAMLGADVSMIAVGTPFDGQEIDLSFVRQAATDIGNALQYAAAYHVVCVKSTVVPGTTQSVVRPLLEKVSDRRLGVDLGLCMNPEFLAEGSAVRDFMEPDRIVIGASDLRAFRMMESIYKPFGTPDLVMTTPTTAEMCKYAANSFLATVISFSNEIANLCAAVGEVDAIDVMQAVHMDRRLSPILPEGRLTPGLMSFLLPGTGFGGSCFPKDVKALVSFGSRIGQPLPILGAVLETNKMQPNVTVGLVRTELGTLRNKRIAVLGLAFKPDTDDVRESPAINIIATLLQEGASVVAHDPIAIESMKRALPGSAVRYCETLDDALSDVDAIVLVTSWPEYKHIHDIVKSNSIPVIDGRRFLDKKQIARYSGIGLSKAQVATRFQEEHL